MSRHVLTCDCGRTIEVDTARAGETLVCECGKTIAVPTLRQLRELPLAVDKKPAQAAREWGATQGVIAACAIVAALALAVAGYSRWTQPEVPEFDAAYYTQASGKLIDGLTPVKAWERWRDVYRPLSVRGFEVFRHPMMDAIELDIARHRIIQMAMLGIAGVAVVIAAGVALAQIGRQGDKETRRA